MRGSEGGDGEKAGRKRARCGKKRVNLVRLCAVKLGSLLTDVFPHTREREREREPILPYVHSFSHSVTKRQPWMVVA